MNSTRIVFSDNTPQRLDHYLVRKYSDFSRSKIQRLIKNHSVKVNDTSVKTGYQLQMGDVIMIEEFEDQNRLQNIIPEPIPLEIIHEDESILVINKPPGMVVHPGTGNLTGTLVNGLIYYYNELSSVNGPLRPGIVHRLDQETSGVIITAKNNKAHRMIANQFKERLIIKKYMGITWGEWKESRGSIEASLKRNRKDPTSYLVDDSGRTAITHFKIIKSFRYMSFVEFLPKTGRTHQIRVHCCYVHHPIVYDRKYNGGLNRIKGFIPEVQKDLRTVIKRIGRHALHANEITFIHPDTGNNVTFEAPIPADMQMVISHLYKHYD